MQDHEGRRHYNDNFDESVEIGNNFESKLHWQTSVPAELITVKEEIRGDYNLSKTNSNVLRAPGFSTLKKMARTNL